MNCRFCDNELKNVFLDLVNSPLSNSYLHDYQLNKPEIFYPLRLFLCDKCYLVQLEAFQAPDEIFNDKYAYYSSYSTDWLEHCRLFVDMIIDRFGFNNKSQIIEIASNDGYLLQFFKKRKIPVLGIEPAANVARTAQEKGIETLVDFFSVELAQSNIVINNKADLIIGNNVFAHVPDISDFVSALKIALKKQGVITLEFPHLVQLIEQNQFDTIYHEHFSYYSFYTVRNIFNKHGLELFDVEQITTHGGSLRIYGKHEEDKSKPISSNVMRLIEEEKAQGILKIEYYEGFKENVNKVKNDLLGFLLEQKGNKKNIAAYGAAAKGNTLLNYCGIKNDLIHFVVDASPHKQNKYLPGSHIPIVDETFIKKSKPDYILILPWNLRDEIMGHLAYIKEWNAKFVLPIPSLEII